MPGDLDDILKDGPDELDEQKLINYLEGKASAEERHEVERHMAESNFTNDAIEGLQGLKNKKDINRLVKDLNRQLHQHIQDRKKHKEKRRIKEDPWVYLAIVLILVLAIISYIIVKKVQLR